MNEVNIIQALEQFEALLRDFAPVMHTYFRDLIKQGFTRAEAFALTVEVQKSLMDNTKGE